MNAFVKKHFFSLLFFTVLGLTSLAYLQGLYGPPVLDDFAHLVRFSGDKFDWQVIKNTLFVSSLGEVARPLSMLTFAVNAYVFHKSMFAAKLCNLLIHLLNGFLIYRLANIVISRGTRLGQNHIQWIALTTASLWVIHPMLLSAVLYAIQRMTLMASLFMLSGILWYCHIRPHFESYSLVKKGWSILLLHFFGALAVLSKENGVLLYGYLLTIELCLFSHERKRSNHIAGLQWIAFGLPIIAVCAYFFYKLPTYLMFYISRDFTLTERLMTESHILFRYLQDMLWPTIGSMGLFQDDAQIIRHLDIITALYMAFWCFITVLPLFIYKKHRILTFCIMWFVVSHILESTILPLELVFVHRNYLALFSVTLLLSYCAFLIPHRVFKSNIIKFAFVLIFCSLWTITQSLAFVWSDETLMYSFFVVSKPDSERANSAFVQTLVDAKQYERALPYVNRMIKNRPYDPGAYIERIRIEGCFLKHKIPDAYWTDLIHSAATMGDVNQFRLFTQRFLLSVQAGYCKDLDYRPFLTFLRAVEQNKDYSGFPEKYLPSTLSEVYTYLASMSVELDDYPGVILWFRQLYALDTSNYTPLKQLMTYQLNHGHIEDAQHTFDSIKKAYGILNPNQPLSPDIYRLEKEVYEAEAKAKAKNLN